MYDDDELRSMSEHERQELARRLAHYTAALPRDTPVTRRRRRRFLNLMVLCCLVLIPWIALLAIKLPRHYVAGHWDAAWVGFDVGLLAWLLLTAWAAWRRRQIVILAALVTATLLVTDAWFDVLTARTHRDLLISAGSAIFIELPLAAILFWVTRRLLHATTRSARRMAGNEELDPPFWKVPLFFVDPEPDAGSEDAGSERSGQETLRSEPGG
jgi:hypothetical protein